MLRTRTLERWIWGCYLAALVLSLVPLLLLCRYVQDLSDAEQRAIRETELGNNLRHSLWWLDSKLSPSLAHLSHQTFSRLQVEVKQTRKLRERGQDQEGPIPDTDRITQTSINPHANLPLPISNATTSFGFSDTEETAEASYRNNSLDWGEIRSEYNRVRGAVQDISAGAKEPHLATTNALPINSTVLPPPQAVLEFNQRSSNNLNTKGFNVGVNPQTSPFVPMWHRSELLLVRQQPRASNVLEAITLDWPNLQLELQKEIASYLPAASFEPVAHADTNVANQLASLPIRLFPGDQLPTLHPMGSAPNRKQSIGRGFVLSAIWGGWFVSMTAVGLLISGALFLMNKRSTFVAAMTHELRTPLTTLRLYTDMLRDGMVTDRTKQGEYLQSLSHELSRIEHLIENVFAFARLERTNRSVALEDHSILDVIHRIVPRLQDRCLQDGCQLVARLDLTGQERVTLNSFCLEQILSNLIDNACKYGDNQSSNDVLLIVSKNDSHRISITVRDYGPGFDLRAPKFRSFSKSVEQAAMTAPGIGLGLAICRDLAIQMNSTLEISNWEHGGSVTLVLVQQMDLHQAPQP